MESLSCSQYLLFGSLAFAFSLYLSITVCYASLCCSHLSLSLSLHLTLFFSLHLYHFILLLDSSSEIPECIASIVKNVLYTAFTVCIVSSCTTVQWLQSYLFFFFQGFQLHSNVKQSVPLPHIHAMKYSSSVSDYLS